jgi:16S rRNA (guanine527-N7)-methyltransferase
MLEFIAHLRELLPPECMPSPDEAVVLERHLDLLVRWNLKLNLTSVRDRAGIVARHYAESLFLASQLPEVLKSLADVGSGAGFPGLPIAVIRPDCQVTLIDSHQRKAVFLREAARGMSNVRVSSERAETVDERYSLLVSRAVDPEFIISLVPNLAAGLALLISREAAEKLMKHRHLIWQEPIPLPWRRSGVVLLGRHVPRET